MKKLLTNLLNKMELNNLKTWYSVTIIENGVTCKAQYNKFTSMGAVRQAKKDWSSNMLVVRVELAK